MPFSFASFSFAIFRAQMRVLGRVVEVMPGGAALVRRGAVQDRCHRRRVSYCAFAVISLPRFYRLMMITPRFIDYADISAR